jgi:hypothetical protein
MKKAIYTDFMDSDYKGRLILSSERTFGDLAEKGVWFEEGMTLVFYTEDYDEAGNIGISCVEGVVEYDLDAERWVARDRLERDQKSFRARRRRTSAIRILKTTRSRAENAA